MWFEPWIESLVLMGFTESLAMWWCMGLLSASLMLNVGRTLTGNNTLVSLLAKGAWGCAVASVVALVLSLWIRSVEADYFALSNMYESLLVVAGWMVIGYLVMDRKHELKYLAWPIILLSVGTIFYATTLPTNIQPLQAALQSYWRAIHVPVILASYAMFALSFVCSVAYLVSASFGFNKHKGNETVSLSTSPMPVQASPDGLLRSESAESKSAESGLSLLMVYDEITYRCIALGFPLLAIGIILGGLWANEAWGNYWSWDPKESMSLVTLLVYGVYLHLRINGEHSENVLAWVSVAGFATMLLTYFGVNLMGVGLHSYGKIG